MTTTTTTRPVHDEAATRRRLFVGNLPKAKTEHELTEEVNRITCGLARMITYKDLQRPAMHRGFCFLDYETGQAAAEAKRLLTRYKMFGCKTVVDWADPEPEPDDEVMATVRILFVRQYGGEGGGTLDETALAEVFGRYGVVERVKKLKNYAFVHFARRVDAHAALDALDGTADAGSGVELDVSWAKPPVDKRARERTLRDRERRMMTAAQRRRQRASVRPPCPVADGRYSSDGARPPPYAGYDHYQYDFDWDASGCACASTDVALSRCRRCSCCPCTAAVDGYADDGVRPPRPRDPPAAVRHDHGDCDVNVDANVLKFFHNIRCGCDKCITASKTDSLRYSMCRVNEYKALASPSLMALSSADPILTAFKLSWELRRLATIEKEFTNEYMELRQQCEQFAVDLLRQTRSSQELDVILKHDSENAPSIGSMKLRLVELAIKYKQKQFVAHPYIQQLLATVWYEGVPGFRRFRLFKQIIEIIKIVYFFPFYCLVYLYAPNAQIGKVMEKPFMKFLIHSSSYLSYLGLLVLVSQRAETQFIELFGSESMIENLKTRLKRQRGNGPSFIELIILHFVIGYIWQEILDVRRDGLKRYLAHNAWNYIEFVRNKMYVAVIALRVYAYVSENLQITYDPESAFIPREQWDTFDPQILADALFAATNILSALKLIDMCSISSHLGPLQLSLKRILTDIVKFFSIYSLVLFSFACGLNQLMWYFANLERERCYKNSFEGSDSCSKWKNFGNVFESIQTLFWTGFGEVDLETFDLPGMKPYTRFWALVIFATYSVINVTIMLNLLIAMMSNSYSVIEGQSDIEWKFSRAKLWLSCFEETPTLPSPYNVYPTRRQFKMILNFIWKTKKSNTWPQNDEDITINKKQSNDEFATVMRALIWRYISMKPREMESMGVTEDDVNEIKSELSTMKYDFLEVLRKNGMEVPSDHRKKTMDKKSKVWERRLMSDFYVAPMLPGGVSSCNVGETCERHRPIDRFRKAVKMVIADSASGRWRTTLCGVYQNSPIGTTARPDSFVNKQNLQWAMNEVWTLRVKRTPSSSSVPAAPASPTATSFPFQLPERPSTLRALIDEFRRGERQHDGCAADANVWSASSAPLPAAVRNCATSWAGAAMARRQLLKAPPQRRGDAAAAGGGGGGAMKKSASVWYAAPPAPDRPLVSRMSMPDLTSRERQHRRRPQPDRSPAAADRIPEEH